MKNIKLKKAPITIIFSLMILFCMFTATSKNIYAQSKDTNDVKAIRKIITIQRNKGAKVSTNLDNKKQYKWSKKTGRLREINWYKKGLKRKINFNKLIELRYINVKRNNLKNIDINKLKNLDVLMCQKNKLNKLNIKGNTKIRILNCSNNNIKKLNVINKKSYLDYIVRIIH